MYIIVWKYEVDQALRQEFEAEYGPNGAWSRLFGVSDGYLDSLLHADADRRSTYLLIDRWRDQESYDAFKAEYGVAYNKQSRAFERLYVKEELVGAFESF